MSSSGGPDDTSPRPAAKPVQPATTGAGSAGPGTQGGTGGGGGTGGVDPVCDIRDVTLLNSPDKAVIATLRAGDVLELALAPGPQILLLARTASGHVAGSITSRSLPQLVECIRKGHKYLAIVQGVTGARATVQIQPR